MTMMVVVSIDGRFQRLRETLSPRSRGLLGALNIALQLRKCALRLRQVARREGLP
jgi:hypothetical protein